MPEAAASRSASRTCSSVPYRLPVEGTITVSASATASSPLRTTRSNPAPEAITPGSAVHTVTAYPGSPPTTALSNMVDGIERSNGLTGGTATTAIFNMAGSLGRLAFRPLGYPRSAAESWSGGERLTAVHPLATPF